LRRALLLAAVLALACGTTAPASPLGEFTSPAGLAATGAGDRDLLFVANSGRDGLRALQLCNHALLLDGGVDPADTCSSKENGQFVPAPIRVFPATIETGGRPLRVAGVRLSQADGGAAGVALATGGQAAAAAADGGVTDGGVTNLAIVDARSLVEAQRDPAALPKAILHMDLGGRTVDVVAANPMHPDLDIEIAAGPGLTVPAFVATETELVVLDVGLDSSGSAQLPAIRPQRCTLAPVVPTKIAIVPGSPDQVYVADGAGDGVVAIATSSIAGGACVMDRISAGGRSVRSVSVSPKWYEAVPGPPGGPPEVQVEHPAGELLIMVVDPLTVAEPGKELDPGGVLLARTGLGGGPKGLLPIPPFDASDTTSERMRPLSLPFFGLTREATFLRSVKPRPSPIAPDRSTCTGAPCTPLYVGSPTTAPVHLFNLLAAASATDGATYFIDVSKRRFVNANLYALENDAALIPTLDLGTLDATQHPVFFPASATAPVLTVDPATVEPGVTRQGTWRVLWHSPIPGLDRRGGTLSPTGTGTLRFTSAPANFAIWQNDPAIKLAPGDVVSFGAFFLAGDNSPACQTVVSGETAYRFELPILAITADSLELGELPDAPQQVGFHPDGCTALGAVAEVRTGGAQPWLVFQAGTAQGRVEADGSFTARQRRFDYPRTTYAPGDASTAPQAAKANDIAFKFAITGPQPTVKSGFTWGMLSGQSYIRYADAIAVSGFATAVYGYSSPRVQTLVFTSITGSNEVLQADPSLLASNLTTGIVAYR
jgi:hypothetical protein